MIRTIGSLFSGIGGLELGLEQATGGHVVWQVEQNEFCSAVLAKHWPDAKRFEDVRAVGAKCLSHVDLICGGSPCQDVSLAGRRVGLTGSRSGLWSEYARIVGELRPRFVVVENVPGLLNAPGGGLGTVLRPLASFGYDAWWGRIGAEHVNAPHRRHRIFVVAWLDNAVRFGRGGNDRRRAGEIASGGIRDGQLQPSRGTTTAPV